MTSTDDKDCYIIECDMRKEESNPDADYKRALAEYKRRQRSNHESNIK